MRPSKPKTHQAVYQFLRTGDLIGSLRDKGFKPREKDNLGKMISSENWTASVKYWLKRFKEIGVTFTLDKAEDKVNKSLDIMLERMEGCSDEHLPDIAERFEHMMALFGGNWSGFNKEEVVHQHTTLNYTAPRQLTPAKQIEEIDDAEVS